MSRSRALHELPDLRTPPLRIVRSPTDRREWLLPAVLFGFTLLSTLVVGGAKAGSPWTVADLPTLLAHPSKLGEHLVRGIPFSIAMLAILGCHEFGHYLTARRHGIDASLPYFIPFPSLLGTMGAVIRLRGTMPTRAALIDVGASGPLAGFIVAVPLLFWGIAHSTVEALPPWPVPPQTLLGIARAFLSDAPMAGPIAGILVAGHGPLVWCVERLMLGPIPAGSYVALHPVAWAAVFGLFVTALNLLPVGQLDGGHVLYALLGARARIIGRILVFALTVLGLVSWPGWLLWAFLTSRIIRTTHPPVDDPGVPLDARRKLIGWAALLLLPLTFAPMPVVIR